MPPDSHAFPEVEPSREVVMKAVAWQMTLHDQNATEGDREAFQAWLKTHPAHAQAYTRLEKLWGQFDGIAPQAGKAALDTVFPPARQHVAHARSLFIAAVAVAAGWYGWQSQPVRYLLADYSTPVGERRVVELDDHSRITLNTYSAIDVDYSNGERRIQLRQGEILVQVAKDGSRPFIVETLQGTARALGTQYAVHIDNAVTQVNVVESTVEACTKAGKPNCVTLSPNQGTAITQDGVAKPHPVDIESLTAWQHGMLAVNNQPLADVLAELERYRRGRIFYDAQQIANLRVSGVFPVNDTDHALDIITRTLPVKTERYSSLILKVERR